MPNLKRFMPGALLLSFAAATPASDAIRCGSRLIGTEALAAEVLGACGEPDYVDRWDVPGAQFPPANLGDVEEWYYNFGPAQLLRILHFQSGRLTDIRADGYGFSAGAHPACGPYALAEGLSKYRLLRACGEPVTRRVQYLLRPLDRRDHRHGGAVSYVYQEEWVYNFGAANLLRMVTLENGRVVDVQSGGRGFD